MTCTATITPVHHVGDDGLLRLVGWRAFCAACGHLGVTRDNYGTCAKDVTKHNRESRKAAA